MDIRAIKTAASGRIDHRCKQLALLFVVVQAAVILLVNLIDFLVNRQLDNATGLAELGSRQIWETVRTVALFAGSLALPIWSFGYMRVGMAAARGEQPDKAMLFIGFHRLFPLLRLTVLRFIFFSVLAFAAIYGGTILYMMTPFGVKLLTQTEELMLQAETLLAQGNTALATELLEGLIAHAWPIYLLGFLGAAVLVVPAFYRLRLADYSILDGENRVRIAMRESRLLSRGYKLQLFRLDLSFWWYYLLTAAASAVAYLDVFLPKWGVAINADAAYWLCLVLSILLQTAVGYFGMPRLQIAYALTYDAFIKDGQN